MQLRGIAYYTINNLFALARIVPWYRKLSGEDNKILDKTAWSVAREHKNCAEPKSLRLLRSVEVQFIRKHSVP